MKHGEIEKNNPTILTAFTRVDEHAEGGLLAYFRATRCHIMLAFGPPNSESDKYKISSEWSLKTPKGEIVSIYDWREDYTHSDGNNANTSGSKIPPNANDTITSK